MPALTNQKHEKFCQLLPHGTQSGQTQGQIYQRCGFRASGHAAEVSASRLLKRDDIRQRLAEMAAPAVKRSKTTLESLIDQFDQVFDGAMGDRQFGAAGSAATVKAKLTGFLRDKLEVGTPGMFATPGTLEEVVDALVVDLGGGDPAAALASIEETHHELVAALATRAVARATIIDVPPALQPSDEAARGLELFRPTTRRDRR